MLYHFPSIFLLLNDMFRLIEICSICLVLKTRVNNAVYSIQTKGTVFAVKPV